MIARAHLIDPPASRPLAAGQGRRRHCAWPTCIVMRAGCRRAFGSASPAQSRRYQRQSGSPSPISSSCPGDWARRAWSCSWASRRAGSVRRPDVPAAGGSGRMWPNRCSTRPASPRGGICSGTLLAAPACSATAAAPHRHELLSALRHGAGRAGDQQPRVRRRWAGRVQRGRPAGIAAPTPHCRGVRRGARGLRRGGHGRLSQALTRPEQSPFACIAATCIDRTPGAGCDRHEPERDWNMAALAKVGHRTPPVAAVHRARQAVVPARSSCKRARQSLRTGHQRHPRR